MYNIFFNYQEPRDFLLKYGSVVTARRRRKVAYSNVEIVIGSYYNYKVLGVGYSSFLCTFKTKEDLIPYLGFSGFSTVDDWYKKISEGADCLYLVKLVEKKNLNNQDNNL